MKLPGATTFTFLNILPPAMMAALEAQLSRRAAMSAARRGGTGLKLWDVPEGPEPWEDTE